MKIAIITGGSKGLGKSAAIETAKRGVGVILTYNSTPDGAQAAVKEIENAGGKAVALKLDVSNTANFENFREDVLNVLKQKWNRTTFDYLVNNAGVGGYSLIQDVTEADFDLMMNVHLKGPFFLTQKLLPIIEDGGHIVNVTSATTRVAFPGYAHYASMKGGLKILTKYMAKEFGARKIRVNSISPGAIRTDLGGGLDGSPEIAQAITAMTALGRVGESVDVGRVVAFLLSEDSQWVNAQDIEISGGMNI